MRTGETFSAGSNISFPQTPDTKITPTKKREARNGQIELMNSARPEYLKTCSNGELRSNETVNELVPEPPIMIARHIAKHEAGHSVNTGRRKKTANSGQRQGIPE
jgi:hypothetical protein